ncbi:MAG: O-methyltransferase [Lachnospiraceae bacterium]|nr:O-methyltransferase [Lachnospiraceae bacterium]
MPDRRKRTFIHALETENSELLEEIEAQALVDRIPIIRKETQSLLKVLLVMQKPMRILEVGTAVGFSALLMSENVSKDCHITTIENYDKRIPVALENFRRMGKEKQISLLQGDAREVLKDITGSFDFIFMDAAKGQYLHYFPEIMRLLSPEGVLLSDNVLQDGTVLESRYAIKKRNRTIHSRMREYLYLLKHHEALTTSIIPIGDGVALSVRKKG